MRQQNVKTQQMGMLTARLSLLRKDNYRMVLREIYFDIVNWNEVVKTLIQEGAFLLMNSPDSAPTARLGTPVKQHVVCRLHRGIRLKSNWSRNAC